MNSAACRIAYLITLSVFFSSNAHAQYFVDEFDGMGIVDWLPGAPPTDVGTFVIEDGKYAIVTGTEASSPDLPDFAQTESFAGTERYSAPFSLRTQIGVEEIANDDYWAGAYVLSSHDLKGQNVGTSLWFVIDEQGTAAIATSVGQHQDTDFTELVRNTGLLPHVRDVSIRFDVSESSAMLWAWDSLGEEPQNPLVIMDPLPDYLESDGRAGLITLNHVNSLTTFNFESFSIQPIPEPSTLTLLAFSVVPLTVLRRKRSRVA